jgi:hypothetical protein
LQGLLWAKADAMTTLAIWITAFVNTAVAAALMLHYRGQARCGLLGEHTAKRRYSWVSCSGFVAAIVIFSVFVSLLDVPTGHGEILIAVPILNVGLSLVLLFVGRTAICWKPVQW